MSLTASLAGPDLYVRHAPSKLWKFSSQPAMFVLEELHGIKVPVGVNAHRGSAVEAGVTLGLLNGADEADCLKEAYSRYDSLTALSADDRREKCRNHIPDMLVQALDELRPYGVPTETQGFMTWHPDDLRYPIVGYFDFLYGHDGIVVDLKTTEKMPGEVKISHARQVGFYCGDHLEGRLTYVTPKKCQTYQLENPQAHRDALHAIARKVENFLSLSTDPDFFISITVPDLENFLWKTPEARELAFRYWRI